MVTRKPLPRWAKAVVCALILGCCLALALTIGDADYHATLVGWAPLLTAVTLIFLALAYVTVARRSLTFQESALFASCTRGERVPFSIRFQNRGPLILLNVRAELFVADAAGGVPQTVVTSLTLGPRGSCEVPFDIPFEHVGLFSAGLREVVITDFLGLFERRIPNERASRICVMPRVPNLGSLTFSDDSDAESYKMLKTALADSLDYAYVRDYEPGDPLKTIHWKLSARTDHYLTRLFEKTISPGVTVLLDFYVPAGEEQDAPELRDAVVESGLAVADYARSRGLDVEIRYMSDQGERRMLTAWDEGTVARMVGELPRAVGDEELRDRALEQVRESAAAARGQSNLVVCTANVGEEMVGAVVDAKRMRKSPFLVAAVPRCLVDRDLERHIARLALLEGHRVGYQAVSRSSDLEGRDL